MSYEPADFWNEYMSGEPDRFTTSFCWCGRRAVEGGLCPVHFDRQAEEESLFAMAPVYHPATADQLADAWAGFKKQIDPTKEGWHVRRTSH